MALSKAEIAFQRQNARDFPRLAAGNFSITSPTTWRYNCIAWAAGDDTKWWWPVNKYWPGGSPQSTSLDAFSMMFGTLGYTTADHPDLENGFEKIALYVNSHKQVTHAARQLPSGLWTSKLGQNYDVTHTLEALEAGFYGMVGKILKRIQLSHTVSAPTKV